MPAIPELIWVSIKPILKLILTACGGALLSRSGILTPAGSKLISMITVNFFSPALLFGKIVVSFSPQNVGELGVLLVSAVCYIVLGMAWGLALRNFFRIDRPFRGGIVAASMWSNWGDIPMAVVSSLAQTSPFTSDDLSKGIAYISIFVLILNITLFPLGGYKLIESDFKSSPKDLEQNARDLQDDKIPTINIVSDGDLSDENERTVVALPKSDYDEKAPKRRASIVSNASDATIPISRLEATESNLRVLANSTERASTSDPATDEKNFQYDSLSLKRKVSTIKSVQWGISHDEPVQDTDPTAAERDGLDLVLVPTGTSLKAVSIKEVSNLTGRIRIWALSIFSPPNIALILGLIIALVPQLKALFVIVSGGPSILAPDNQPPLAFVYDTVNFVGGAAVPCGIMLLGAALSRLKFNNIKPIPCIALALVKLVLNPIIGILCVRALVAGGLINPTDKMLQFVIMFESAIPSATFCVYLTQMYSPTGEAKDIAAYLVVQYALGIFTMIISICIMLSLLS